MARQFFRPDCPGCSRVGKAGLKIPFFGQGYGTQILALFLLAVIAILGMSERISSDAIAGVLGAIAGYIFGTTVGARRDD